VDFGVLPRGFFECCHSLQSIELTKLSIKDHRNFVKLAIQSKYPARPIRLPPLAARFRSSCLAAAPNKLPVLQLWISLKCLATPTILDAIRVADWAG